MEILKINALRGPNVWANFPVLEVWVKLGVYNEKSSEEYPGFNDRLKSWLPSLIEHRCSVGERGGFFVRLDRGTYLGHILEHVALELQTLAGTNVGFGRARETSVEGTYRVAIKYQEEKLGLEAIAAARELIMAAVHDTPFDVPGTIARLKDLAHDLCLGPSTRSIVDAARARGIPWRRLTEGSMVQFGYGARIRRICAAETDRTGAIAEMIAQDKELTKKILREIGVPVPEGRPVTDADDAWEAAQEIGLPVVVKPQNGNQGRGVATNLRSEAEVRAAYAAAYAREDEVLLEKYAPGCDWRLLVIGDKLIAAARREPAHVIGDGKHNIRELVDEVNKDPRRSDGHATALSFVKLDDVALEVLKSQGYDPETVLPAGLKVQIRRNANLSTGGTAEDVTETVHPDVAARAIEAAKVVGLDIAGIDIVAEDITQPLEPQHGVIVEVNAAPGLRMHLEPSAGKSRAVGEAIIQMMFGEDQTGRIPIVAVTGTNGKTTTTRLIAHILRRRNARVGMTTTDGIFLNDRLIDNGDCSGPKSARCVLSNPCVDAAVFETARGGIVREGLGFDLCDVGVVTNIGSGDHLGLADIQTTEQLAKVKRVVVDTVSRDGSAVLNADDPLVVEMAEYCKGGVIFFSRDENSPVLKKHLEQGKPVTFVRDNKIIQADREGESTLMSLDLIPLTHGGRILFQVDNVLAAAAACWGLGIDEENIIAGLETFTPDLKHSPGRFNMLDVNGATVIVDYGHNTSSLETIVATLKGFDAKRRLAVYSAAGDRRDEDFVAQGRLLGENFDEIVIYEGQYIRGRERGEITKFFKQGILEAAPQKKVHAVVGAVESMDLALAMLQPGDLLLMQADEVAETVAYIKKKLAEDPLAVREVDPADAVEVAPAVQN